MLDLDKKGNAVIIKKITQYRKSRCVSFYLEGVSLFDKEQWETMLDFYISKMIKLENSMREHLKSFKKRLNDKDEG